MRQGEDSIVILEDDFTGRKRPDDLVEGRKAISEPSMQGNRGVKDGEVKQSTDDVKDGGG